MEVKNVVDVIQDIIVRLELSEEQVNFIRKYSRVRTAKRFEKEALTVIGSSELAKDWSYGGYSDSGYFGGAKCSRGHTLRYVHFAHNVVTGEDVRFGVKCASDFFSLSKEQLRMISHGVAEANNEILSSLQWLDKVHSFEEYVKMGNTFGIFDDVKEFVKPADRAEIQEWRDVQLPLPYRLQAIINRANSVANNGTEFGVWLDKHPVIKEVYEKGSEFVSNPKFDAYVTIIGAVKDILKGVQIYKNLPDWQNLKLKKYLEADYDRIETIVSELKMVQHLFKQNDFVTNIASDIMTKYTKQGVSEKQMAILEKAHAKFFTKIEELKLENC